MNNVVIYTRVSTDEQAKNGYSLSHQKFVLTKYCEHHKLKILKLYEEDYSAKNFDRPAFRELKLQI